jgi:hypothetical protein
MKKERYRVTLPIEVDGKFYNYDEVVELDVDAAALYAHALIAVEEKANGGNSEGL